MHDTTNLKSLVCKYTQLFRYKMKVVKVFYCTIVLHTHTPQQQQQHMIPYLPIHKCVSSLNNKLYTLYRFIFLSLNKCIILLWKVNLLFLFFFFEYQTNHEFATSWAAVLRYCLFHIQPKAYQKQIYLYL